MVVTDFSLFSLGQNTSKTEFDLGRILQPLSSETFFAEYWEKKPYLLKRAEPAYYNQLFSLRDIDYIISSTDLRYPTVRLVKDGVGLPLSSFAEDVAWGNDVYKGTIIPEKLYEHYRQGASVVFQALHRFWRPLALFCRRLEKQLNHHVQTNLYLTPPNSQGFKPHYDTHDVFILQIAGSKFWRIYRPPLELPHRSQPSDNAALLQNPGELVQEFNLEAGDLFYMPRGYVHEALTSQTESLHITLGVTAFTYLEVLSEIINEASQQLKTEPLFRRSLPIDFGANPQQEFDPAIKTRFLELVTACLQDSNLSEAAAKLHKKFVNNQTAFLDEQLLQLSQLDNLNLESVVCQRPANIYRFYRQTEQIVLEFNGKSLNFPDYADSALDFILTQEEEPFRVGEIGPTLDDSGKLVLVRRLVNEGFLRLVGLE